MGVVGAILVSRWSLSLLNSTSAVLLDKQEPKSLEIKIRQCIEVNDCKIIDLHLWSIGPNIYSAIISVLARSAKKPEYYKKLISSDPRLVHLTVEVNESSEEDFSE